MENETDATDTPEFQKFRKEILESEDGKKMTKDKEELKRHKKLETLKKIFNSEKNEGMDIIADWLIHDLKLKEKKINPQKIEFEIEYILNEKATAFNVREILGKIKRKVYNISGNIAFQPLGADELIEKQFKEEEYLIKSLVPKNGITILAGQPGIGKSWLLLALGYAISSGQELFGKLPVSKTKTLLIDEESPYIEIQRRIKLLKVQGSNFNFLSQHGIKLDNENQTTELIAWLEKNGYGLVIIDSLRAVNNLDENSSTEMEKLVDAMRNFNRVGISVLLCHHHKKENFLNSKDPSQILRGSSALLAGIDSLISVETEEKSDSVLEFNLTHSKLRRGKKLNPFQVEMAENVSEGIKFTYKGEIETEVTQRDKAKQFIKEFLKEGQKFRQEILGVLIPRGISVRTANRAIKDMRENDEIIINMGEKGKVYLELKEP